MTRRFFKLRTSGNLNDASLAYVDKFFHDIEVKSYCPGIGKPIKPFWPEEARLSLSKTYKGVKLRSFLGNEQNLILVNRTLCEVVERLCPKAEIEYLPFVLLDHRNRELSKDYYLVNPIGGIECLDKAKSEITYSDAQPKRVLDIAKYVLDRKKLEKAPELFRIGEQSTDYVVSSVLLDEWKKLKATNVVTEELPFGDEV
jgi:hypothetical protein